MDHRTLYDRYAQARDWVMDRDVDEPVQQLRAFGSRLQKNARAHGLDEYSHKMHAGLSDRIDQLDDIVTDLRHELAPRVNSAGKSLRSYWKHHRNDVVTVVVAAAFVTAVVASFESYRRNRKEPAETTTRKPQPKSKPKSPARNTRARKAEA